MSTTDGWLKLNFTSCVIRQTRSLGVLVVCSNRNMAFVNYISTMWLLILRVVPQFYGRPFTRGLYLFLMKDIGRWLPWVLPGSTGRFYEDDVVHSHSAHGYYITRMEGGVRYAWYCLHVKQNKKNWAKTAIHILRELDLVTFHTKDYLSDEASKIDVRIWWYKNSKLQVRGTPCKCCSRSQQRSSPGLRLRVTPRLVLIARVYGEYHILSSVLLLLLIIYDKAHFTHLW